jgi:glycosyltransferase involved in cell wall biosynthesis
VVCSYDRLHYVQRCVEALTRQSVGRGSFEIILVDNGSSPPVAVEMERIVEALSNARLVRLEAAGLSLARNEGARAASGDYVAYIDDDAMATPDWIEQIRHVLAERGCRPVVLGGKVLPIWESPLPDWWPVSLRGVLSIIEHDGAGEYRTDALPATLAPYGVNMILRRDVMLQHGGFDEALGRHGLMLLSDEDVQLAWRLQDAGLSTIYDSRVVVRHSIQAKRLTPDWLITRLYWQGTSAVRTRLMLGQTDLVRRELLRRLFVEALTLPFAWTIPRCSTRLIALRWRHAYASGFRKELFSRGTGRVVALLRRRKLMLG